jgi:hypothetical protein
VSEFSNELSFPCHWSDLEPSLLGFFRDFSSRSCLVTLVHSTSPPNSYLLPTLISSQLLSPPNSYLLPTFISSQLLSPPTAHLSSSLYRHGPTFTPCHSLLTTPISNRLDTLSVCLGWVHCCSLLPFSAPMAPCTTRTLPSLRSVAPLLPHDP